MNDNGLCRLRAAGQSAWLDFITRELVRSGRLQEMIEDDCICGLTTNPTIFQKAVSGSADYDDDISRAARDGVDTEELYHRLILDDALEACRALFPLFQLSRGADGFVSVEVSPERARDAVGTVREAIELVDEAQCQPNLMIKVPGTVEGLEAIRKLTAKGININVTLIFSPAQYATVAQTFMSGLEDRAAAGKPIDSISSVASVFISRIDTAIDKTIDARLAEDPGGAASVRLAELRGRLAIDTAQEAYRANRRLYTGERWRKLAELGARPQRLLWGSTGTKDPAYSDVKYVEELIGPETVNTMPLATLEAFADHGRVEPTLGRDLDAVDTDLAAASDLGIDLGAVYNVLLEEGIEKFSDSYRQLLDLLEEKRHGLKAA